MKRVLARLPEALAIAAVLAAYAFFGGGASFDFRRISWQDSYYASLSEGFFRGHLYMAHEPNPKLAAVSYPYDPKIREGIDYLWDTSYFNGHYYLYFSPLPAVGFYMPYRLLRGGYPRDALAATVFSAWAFMAAVMFLRRALALRGKPLRIPLPLWILLAGFGNVVVFLLIDIRTYEVAIMCAMAMSATWAYALLRFAEAPSRGRALWVGVWLALALAARPNLGVLLFVTAYAIWRAERRSPRGWRGGVLAAVPLAITGVLLVAYNLARFGRPLEFGVTYQLTFVPMAGRAVCSLCNLAELSRFGDSMIHYLFWPLVIRSQLPFTSIQFANPDPATSFPMPGSEQIVGIFPLVPLTMLGALFAALLALRRGAAYDAGTHTALQLMAASWLILIGLATCWWLVSRYSLDFMMLMAVATAVCIEEGLAFLAAAGIRVLPLRVLSIALACYTVIISFLLGFAGPYDQFKDKHKAVYERITRALK